MDFEIDLDSECVWLDDAWFNRDDLVRKVKAMIDAGDYQIARPSQALEALTRALANARLLALRINPEMSDALNAAAQQTNRPIGALVRDAIAAYLESVSVGQGQPSVEVEEPITEPPPEMSAMPAVENGSPSVVVAADAVSEPGSADGVPNNMVFKHKEEREEVEKRWFDK